MTRGMGLAAGLAALIALAGCAGMDQPTCVAADWRTVGYNDGVQGRTLDALEQHTNDCTRHGAPPQLDAYMTGRESGLVVFCQPWQGYGYGLRNKAYTGVCPANLEPDFLAAFHDGRRQHQLQSAYNHLRRQVQRADRKIDQLDTDLDSKERRLVAKDLDTNQRLKLIDQIRRLAEERGRLYEQLPALESQLVDADAELAAYQAAMAQRYPGGR